MKVLLPNSQIPYKFFIDNGIDICGFEMIPVVSLVSDSNYGIIYKYDFRFFYCKHKAVKFGSCSKIQYTTKEISKEQINQFRITNHTEISILEMQEEKLINNS